MAQIGYFDADLSQIARHADETDKCSVCSSQEDPLILDRESGQYGCLNCLLGRNFQIYQETEIGELHNGQLKTFDVDALESVSIDAPKGFEASALVELGLTPQFASKQYSTWLVHCDDFMDYTGRWDPMDFNESHPDDPRGMYVSMADDDPQLWDESVEESTNIIDGVPDKWAYNSWCYVFQCRKCEKKRCFWDCG